MRTEISVPSDLRFVVVVERWLIDCLQLQLKDSVDFSERSLRLRLAVVEAFSNVVRHAHEYQTDIPVCLCLEVTEREIAIEIWDRGQGFEIANFFPPENQELKEGGYGWLIINRLMDTVEYYPDDCGRNCLRLKTFT
jgi:serine/threonine-protein kinase RsbW